MTLFAEQGEGPGLERGTIMSQKGRWTVSEELKYLGAGSVEAQCPA
jgi:hypothetical protein